MNQRQLQTYAWAISGAVTLVALIAWGQAYGWSPRGLGLYSIFPLLGLVAFGLMWTHYIASVTRQYIGLKKAVLKDYFDVTSGMVLVLILAHPGLLAWQRWRDGFGLPPGSELTYVSGTLRLSIITGMIALVVFLLFELHRIYSDRSWWKYVEIATDVAMVMIYVHALRLGGQLQAGWFRAVWLFYGVTLAASLVYMYAQKLKAKHKVTPPLVKS